MKKFISPYGWFSLEYPDTWYEFEDEEGSFLFYNPNKWTGNLRVSAFKDASRNYARQLMQDELNQSRTASLKKIGPWDVVFSQDNFQEEGEQYTNYVFLTGTGNTAVEFYFTVSVGKSPKEVEQVISSLVVRDEKKHYPKEIIPVRVWEIQQIDEAFEWVSKAVKKSLKKDFTGEYKDLEKLQQLIDSGVYPSGQRGTWEAVGIAFATILINEMDGMEWVTVVDGKKEYPALQFTGAGFYLEPMKFLSEKMKQEGTCNLRTEFDRIKAEIESKL